jgi:hypothetical protein
MSKRCIENVLKILYMSILRVNGDITVVAGSRMVNVGYAMLQNKVIFCEFITG